MSPSKLAGFTMRRDGMATPQKRRRMTNALLSIAAALVLAGAVAVSVVVRANDQTLIPAAQAQTQVRTQAKVRHDRDDSWKEGVFVPADP